MNDVINRTIASYIENGGKLEGVKSYIQKKYNINIDSKALHERLKSIKLNYKFN